MGLSACQQKVKNIQKFCSKLPIQYITTYIVLLLTIIPIYSVYTSAAHGGDAILPVKPGRHGCHFAAAGGQQGVGCKKFMEFCEAKLLSSKSAWKRILSSARD
jgi:hypothetical protein